MTKKSALILAGALIVLGIICFPLQNLGKPDAECVPEGSPSSGFVDDESGCAISIESWEEISDWNSGPKLFRIAGLILIVGGVGVGIYGLTRKSTPRTTDTTPTDGPPGA